MSKRRNVDAEIAQDLDRLRAATHGIVPSANFASRVMAALPASSLLPAASSKSSSTLFAVGRSWRVAVPMAIGAALASLLWARAAANNYEIAALVSDPVQAQAELALGESAW